VFSISVITLHVFFMSICLREQRKLMLRIEKRRSADTILVRLIVRRVTLILTGIQKETVCVLSVLLRELLTGMKSGRIREVGPINMSDVIRQVTRLVGDEYETQVQKTDILDWANEYIMLLSREAEFNQLLLQVNYTPATTGVALPPQFIGEKRVTFNDVALEKTSLTELDDIGGLPTDTSSGVTHFYMWGNFIWLYPTPSVTGALKMWYVAAVNAVADLDADLPLPLIYHKDVVRACVMRFREQSEDYEQLAAMATEVDKNTAKIIHDQTFQSRETYPIVKPDPWDAYF